MLDVKRLTREDLQEARTLVSRFCREERPDTSEEASLAFLEAFLGESGELVAFGASKDDVLLGLVCLCVPLINPLTYPKIVANEVVFYVIPEARKLGVGSKLLDCVEVWCKDNNVSSIIFGAKAVDEKVIRYYQLHGYTPYEVMVKKEIN